MAASKKPEVSLPKTVWVTFSEGMLPEGVTRLAEEADEWRGEGTPVYVYDLRPSKPTKKKARKKS